MIDALNKTREIAGKYNHEYNVYFEKGLRAKFKAIEFIISVLSDNDGYIELNEDIASDSRLRIVYDDKHHDIICRVEEITELRLYESSGKEYAMAVNPNTGVQIKLDFLDFSEVIRIAEYLERMMSEEE